MYYWFSTYTGDNWTPDKGYNAAFRDHVVMLREWFRLRKAGTGREEGTGYWREYLLQGKKVYVTVDNLVWSGSKSRGSDDYCDYGKRPVFKMDIRLAMEGRLGNRDEFFSDTLTIEFPQSYPSSPPFFRLNKYRRYRASHDHHLNGQGWLCLMGYSNDWDPDRDTIISGINMAFDWIVWHNDQYGK